MKSLFPGYYRHNDDEMKSTWKCALIVLDSSVLLNLYRYSPETTASFVDILRRLNDRLWLPYQVALEFHRNRLQVIAKQTSKYAEIVTELKGILESLENKREHPFLDGAILETFRAVTGRVIENLGIMESHRNQLLHKDELLHQLADIFEVRVGAPLNQERQQESLKLAQLRCEQHIPPGYKDEAKGGHRQYGDVLVWLEVLQKAKESSRPVVMVTDDGKEDWWLEIKGQTIGVRPELVAEFKEKTNQTFLLYLPVA